MMKRLVTAFILATAAIPTSALAWPTPNLEAADPDTFVPAGNSASPTINLTVYGENIAPEGGGHPDYREYWHIFMRSVGPDGVAGPWSHCDDSDGCGLIGFNSEEMILTVTLRRWATVNIISSELILTVTLRRWASVNHSTLQMRYYTGLDDPSATDPSVNRYSQPLSGWSNIWSWKVAVVPAAAPPAPPKIVAHARLLKVIPVAAPPKGVVRLRPGLIERRPIGVQSPVAVPTGVGR